MIRGLFRTHDARHDKRFSRDVGAAAVNPSRVTTPGTRGLRVAYVVNLYPAVSQTFIRREIHALERPGVTVVRIAFRGWDAPVVDVIDKRERSSTRYVLERGLSSLMLALLTEATRSPRGMLRALGLAWRMGTLSGRRLIHLAYLAEACVLRRWASEAGAEHLHAHFATNSAEVVMLARALGAPQYSFTAHGSDIGDRPAQVGLPLTVAHAAFVTTVCSFGRSQIFKWVDPALWGRVHVIGCGLERGYGRDMAPASNTGPLLCIGRLSKEKGQLVLLHAVRQLSDAGERVDVVVAGDGPMRSELQAMIGELRLESHVRLAGVLDGPAVQDALRSARALVVPSLSEGLPVVIMEAFAAGRPVIAPFLGGIPELVTDGLNGWLYPAGDAALLAAAMRRALHASETELRRMGSAARDAVWAAHDVDEAARKLNDLFRASACQ
jgi:glycosyltransferase involved in cell wall biosynthesis